MMSLSVIIPVKNGAATLERCLQSLRNQTIGKDLEIIILDSMSTDGSRAIAETYGVKIIDVPEGTFDHGLTRNVGVQNASGELIYLTVQDAWIGDKDMLERMVRHFADPEVTAVTGHQAVPHEKDKNPIQWYRRYSEHLVEVRQVTDIKAFEKLSQSEKQKLIAWDNVIAMYRRSALIGQPFIETEFAEDWKWSYDALMRGWKLLRDSSLVVFHYHHRSAHYVFNTTYSLNYHFYRFFQFIPSIPSIVNPVFRIGYHFLKNQHLNYKERLYWIGHSWVGIASEWLSTLTFLISLKSRGRKGITKGYQKFCKTIPQGSQKSK